MPLCAPCAIAQGVAELPGNSASGWPPTTPRHGTPIPVAGAHLSPAIIIIGMRVLSMLTLLSYQVANALGVGKNRSNRSLLILHEQPG
jgi:hypothetical protein